MAYDKKTWAKYETINVEELNHIEQGIDDAHTIADAAAVAVAAIPDMSVFMLHSVYDPDEDGKVNSSVIADTLTDGESPKTYANISAEIDSDISTHTSNASAHHTRYTDAEALAAVNNDVTHGTSASHSYRTDEEIRDVAAAMLVQGSNVTITVDDAANTVTIASTGLTEAQQTKLDGIESGATTDQTGTEIVTAINGQSSKINAANLDVSGVGLTEEQLAKLNGIETGSTADQTGAEIVAAINGQSDKINVANLTLPNLAVPIERGFVGEVVAGDTLRIAIRRAGTILSAALISETQPVGESLMVDIRKNDVATTNSIFTNDTPMILATNATVTNGVFTVNGTLDDTQTSVAVGDILRVYVTQAGSAVDVSVCLEVLY
jgi:hypothetical protein